MHEEFAEKIFYICRRDMRGSVYVGVTSRWCFKAGRTASCAGAEEGDMAPMT